MKQRYFWTVVLGMALAVTATAKDHGDKGKGNGKGNSHSAQKHNDHDSGWEVRDGWEYRTYAQGQTPPGWNKGKKTGWGNCNMPPGLAKKSGCNMYRYQNRDYYWYHDDVGRIVIRRPVISIHGGVDIGL